MVAGFAEVNGRGGILVAEACNHPNLLVLPFSLELFLKPDVGLFLFDERERQSAGSVIL